METVQEALTKLAGFYRDLGVPTPNQVRALMALGIKPAPTYDEAQAQIDRLATAGWKR